MGAQQGALYQVKLNLARKLVFGKVKEALGLSGIEAVASGSAALQPRLARFFNGAGITVLEGYGLTETSPVVSVNTTNGDNMLRIGSVGKLADGVSVKIADDGEILVQGPNVMMGYYKDPEKTAEVLKDGWFHTGDIGVMEDGFLRITDRKKEISRPQAASTSPRRCWRTRSRRPCSSSRSWWWARTASTPQPWSCPTP